MDQQQGKHSSPPRSPSKSAQKESDKEIIQHTMSSVTSEDHQQRSREENDGQSMADGYESCDEKEPESLRESVSYTRRQRTPANSQLPYKASSLRERLREANLKSNMGFSSEEAHRATSYLFDLEFRRSRNVETRHREEDFLKRTTPRSAREREKRRQSSLDEWMTAGDRLFGTSSRNRQ